MMSRHVLSAGLLAVLAACQTTYAPPLDEYTLTTANGVRFRTTSGIDNTCDTPYYSDPVGFGVYSSTVEQNGKVRKNAKFNFSLPGQESDNQPLREARLLTTNFADEFEWACNQWRWAPEEEKSIYLDYFHEAITLTFEAATRFETAGSIGSAALQAEIDPMRKKLSVLRAQRPKKERYHELGPAKERGH